MHKKFVPFVLAAALAFPAGALATQAKTPQANTQRPPAQNLPTQSQGKQAQNQPQERGHWGNRGDFAAALATELGLKTERVQAALDKVRPQDRAGEHGPHGGQHAQRGPGHAEEEQAIAKALGLSAQELRTQLASGKTLEQLAASKGVSAAQLQQIRLNAAKAHLQSEVKAGRLTQAQADQMLADIQAGKRPARGRR